MKHTVSRKNYHTFLQSCVDKCYAGTMSWKEYKEMEIQLEPIDFTPFPHVSKTNREYIERMFTEEDTDSEANYMVRGFTRHEYTEKDALGMSFGDGGNGYSWWAYNDRELMLYTFCEGDTTLTICKTAEDYAKAKESARQFYAEKF